MESRRNGPQLSSRHDDDDDDVTIGPSCLNVDRAMIFGQCPSLRLRRLCPVLQKCSTAISASPLRQKCFRDMLQLLETRLNLYYI